MKDDISSESISRQLAFLRDLAANNNREWFLENKLRYEEANSGFDGLCKVLIASIGEFDDTVRHLSPKDCTWRIYRDVRFSHDKSPYKRHFGCYVSARGKKSYHGGYYFHLEPGACMVAEGCWELPTRLLNMVRQNIVDGIDDFRAIVEDEKFSRLYKAVTFQPLKVMPHGIDRSFPYPQYVKCRNYCVDHGLEDDFFKRKDWLECVVEDFKVMKPFLDFVNDIVDDYI